MRFVLWGPSEHVSADQQAALARRLRELGQEVRELGLGEPAPADANCVVINTKTRIGPAELAAMPVLHWVITTTSGHDHVDLTACGRHGVRIVRCPRARRDAVVDCSMAMSLALLRRLPLMERAARSGDWIRADVRQLGIPLLRNLPIGVIGHGVIGRAAAAAWRALGARVLVADPAQADTSSVSDLLRGCRVVTLHCSLTESSAGLIDSEALAIMQPGAVLVNTARGECIDVEAVLTDTRLGGFGLDVFSPEPHPRMTELAARENAILTPHSAGYHDRLGPAISDEVVGAATAIVRGVAPPGEIVAQEYP